METIKLFFEQTTHIPVREICALPASGSARKNFIVHTDNECFIVTENKNITENRAFIYFSTIFSSLGLNTPDIVEVSNDEQLYIQTYLGKETLSEIIAREGESVRVNGLVRKTLDALFELQQKTIDQIDYSQTFEYKEYNRLPILHDCHYFKFMLVDILEIEYHKATLLSEFERLTSFIEKTSPKGLMMRDFQSRNIIVNEHKEDSVFFIDYQSAMFGPLLYDVVSFLFQAKANFSEKFIRASLEYYIEKFPTDCQIELWKALPVIRLIRTMQVLGAYGFRGLIQRKKHFIDSLEIGIANIALAFNQLVENEKFTELKKVISSLQSKETQQKIHQIIYSQ